MVTRGQLVALADKLNAADEGGFVPVSKDELEWMKYLHRGDDGEYKVNLFLFGQPVMFEPDLSAVINDGDKDK